MKEGWEAFKLQENSQKIETLETGYKQLLMNIQATTKGFEELKAQLDIATIRTDTENLMKRNLSLYVDELFKNKKKELFDELMNKVDDYYKKDMKEIYGVLQSHKQGLNIFKKENSFANLLIAELITRLVEKNIFTKREIIGLFDFIAKKTGVKFKEMK